MRRLLEKGSWRLRRLLVRRGRLEAEKAAGEGEGWRLRRLLAKGKASLGDCWRRGEGWRLRRLLAKRKASLGNCWRRGRLEAEEAAGEGEGWRLGLRSRL